MWKWLTGKSDEKREEMPSGLLSDKDIMKLCVGTDTPMISPFSKKLTDVGKISHGLSSYGYDITLADSFKIFNNVNNVLLDPKEFNEKCFVDHVGEYCIIPPNGFILCHTVETFNMPEDVLAICIGKSTYARLGLNLLVTPLEPGWSGQLTLEITNGSPLPAKVYSFEGIGQLLFFRSASKCLTPYNKRGGKYMHQKGVVLPKLLERADR